MAAVAATGDRRAIEPLVRALTYNDAALYEVAVRGLAQIGEPAVEPLLACLDQIDYGARYHALRALVAIGDARARAAYEHWLAADIAPSVRRMCVKGLAAFPDGDRLVLVALGDNEWSVRYTAIQALADRGLTPETRTAIEAKLTDAERVVRLKASQVLTHP
jgi:phycocyanobilin lyase beta subunit